MSAPGQDPVSERWSEVDRLYDRALDVAVEERETFLTDACGDDRVLFETVSRLLEASNRGEGAFSSPPAGLLRAALGRGPHDAAPELSAEGQLIGAYRLIRRVGRGGMATVYEAERADGAFTKRVAIKVLRGLDSAELTTRFLAEREILSKLSHPHIARVVDGGATERGEPYLVMEWVEGRRITLWADERRLDVRGRLTLVCQLADAIQYAHTHLVVHRDIKPSNVLVSDTGQAHLLDFGIAKLLEPNSVDGPGTRTATRWMTPEYAAPEQLLGQSVTTATDVYALGVLLHELLTGRRPLQGESSRVRIELTTGERTAPAMSSTVDRSDEEIAAARSTTPAGLRRALHGDLDAIVAKALRHRTEDRYASPRDLADDLARHLEARPVLARTGLRAYRLRRFLVRNRVAVATAALAVSLLIGGFGAALWQAGVARAERARAEAEMEDGRIVINFLADIFRGRDPAAAPGDTVTARELLAWGSDRVNVEFADRPALQADLLLVLADSHRNLGQLEDGVILLEKAVEVRRGAFGWESEEVAAVLMRLGSMHTTALDFEAAEAAFRDALSIRRALGSEGPAIAAALEGLALTMRDTDRADSAEILLRDAMVIRARHPDDPTAWAAATLSLASVLRALERFDESVVLYEEGIAAHRTLPERDDRALAIHLNNLGYLYRVTGALGEAEARYRQALELSTASYGPAHPQRLLVLNNLASVLHEQGRLKETAEILRIRLEALQTQWPDGHWRLGEGHRSLAFFLIRAGSLVEGERHARLAAEQFEEVLGPTHDWTSFAWALVAVARLLVNDADPGQATLDRLHTWLEHRRNEAGGELPGDLAAQLEPLLLVLRDTGLEVEHRRFAELLAQPSTPSSPDP